tara:strand:+ start:361 stop:531 length:171 start_codon:yes stop_codon:yes gene_type:complete
MATREEVRRTDNSKLGRAVLSNKSSFMRGIRGKVDVVAEAKKIEKKKKTKKSENKD